MFYIQRSFGKIKQDQKILKLTNFLRNEQRMQEEIDLQVTDGKLNNAGVRNQLDPINNDDECDDGDLQLPLLLQPSPLFDLNLQPSPPFDSNQLSEIH